MMQSQSPPDVITVEFLNAALEPLKLSDLSSEFLTASTSDVSRHHRPFKIAIRKKTSKAGNGFYEYSQNGVTLPDGFSTFIRVEGILVPMGKTRPSRKGHPTREGSTQIVVGGMEDKVVAYLTESRTPYYVKMVAHKKPETSRNIAKALRVPRGGEIVQ